MVRTSPRPIPHRRLSRGHQASKRRANRRRANWPKRILAVVVSMLVVECVLLVLFSPRFYVQHLTIQGLETLSEPLVREQISIKPTQNLFLAPTQQWAQQVKRIPGVATVSVERVFPKTICLVVQERKPWATVRTRDQRWHTIDDRLIPFRVGLTPEPNLPRVLASDLAPWEAVPGMEIPSPGLLTAQKCERWMREHPDFRITQIEIDPDSKVCLNRVGGVPIYLGSEVGISEKLNALEKLLLERPDLSYSTTIGYVNLYSPDAPAIGPVPTKKSKP